MNFLSRISPFRSAKETDRPLRIRTEIANGVFQEITKAKDSTIHYLVVESH